MNHQRKYTTGAMEISPVKFFLTEGKESTDAVQYVVLQRVETGKIVLAQFYKQNDAILFTEAQHLISCLEETLRYMNAQAAKGDQGAALHAIEIRERLIVAKGGE